MASTTGTLYIGVTNDMERRMAEHKSRSIAGFASKYGCIKLVYYEYTTNIDEAIGREKQMKSWRRSKKEALIRFMNPLWKDLGAGLS